MFRQIIAAAAVTLMLGATAGSSANVERETPVEASAEGTGIRDVMPISGGSIEVHVCPSAEVDGPLQIVEFGRSASDASSGVQLVVDRAPTRECAHLVVFTQPVPSRDL